MLLRSKIGSQAVLHCRSIATHYRFTQKNARKQLRLWNTTRNEFSKKNDFCACESWTCSLNPSYKNNRSELVDIFKSWNWTPKLFVTKNGQWTPKTTSNEYIFRFKYISKSNLSRSRWRSVIIPVQSTRNDWRISTKKHQPVSENER